MKNVVKIGAIIALMTMTLSSLAQKKSKEEKQQIYEEAVRLVESGEYKFIADWAYTQKGRQVNLMSNPNYLKIEGNKAVAELPYFGVVTSGSAGYGVGDSGIAFNDEMTGFSIERKDKKRRLLVKFRVRKGSELFDCTLTVNGPESANLVVTSSVRQLIRYVGKLSVE